MSNKLDRLERRIGYQFKDQDLLVLALTHRSLGGRNNERLEFLGDSILNFVAAEMLFQHSTTPPVVFYSHDDIKTIQLKTAIHI